MPRFYFHIRDGGRLIEDEEGSNLPDLAGAQAEALASARELLATKVRAGEVINDRCFEITDEAGTVRAIIPMRDALHLS